MNKFKKELDKLIFKDGNPTYNYLNSVNDPLKEDIKQMEKKEKGSLYKKILAIRKAMPYFQKDVTGFKYQYVSGCKVLETFREVADELGVLLLTNITESHIENKVVSATINYTFVDIDSGEELVVPFYGYGEQTDASKAFGSMLTYSERYFLLKFFNVPTDNDDPDARQEPNEKKTDTKKNEYEAILKSKFISKAEHDAWEKKKNGPDREKAINYIKEKVELGERLIKAIASRGGSENEILKIISLEFMPLTVEKAKEKYAEILKGI